MKVDSSGVIGPCVGHVTQWRNEGASSAVKVLLDQYAWSGPGCFWKGNMHFVVLLGEDKAALNFGAFRPGQAIEAPAKGGSKGSAILTRCAIICHLEEAGRQQQNLQAEHQHRSPQEFL